MARKSFPIKVVLWALSGVKVREAHAVKVTELVYFVNGWSYKRGTKDPNSGITNFRALVNPQLSKINDT